MLKKAALLLTALSLSACAGKELPQTNASQSATASQESSEASPGAEANDDAALIGPDATAQANAGTAEDAPLIASGEEASLANGEIEEGRLAAAPEAAAQSGQPETAAIVNNAETACPTINGSFVLTIGGEIRDRITIQTKRENGRLAYSINNGEFYETQNKVHRSEGGALARVACDRDLVRLNYRNSSGSQHGKLEILSLGEGQIKVSNTDGRIAMSGMYVSAQ